MAAPFPIQSLANGAVKWSDGSIRGNMSTPQGYAANVHVPNTTMSGGFQQPAALSNPQPAPSGGGGGGAPAGERAGGTVNGQWYPADQYDAARRANEDPYAQVRSDISSAWDNFLSSFPEQEQYVNEQRAAQEGIVGSQLKQGLGVVKEQGAKSLRDIANTTRNAFQAGNNYLGSLGAGDSSGANQYAFAINQDASKQTGKLNEFVMGETNKLKATADQQIQGIAQWFAQAQQQLKQQIAEGRLKKGQDLANLSKGILDQAIQATNQVKANSQNQYNALVQWAASNSQNLGELQQNIAGIPQVMGQLNLGPSGGTGGPRPMYGGGVPSNGQETDIFGNPLRR